MKKFQHTNFGYLEALEYLKNLERQGKIESFEVDYSESERKIVAIANYYSKRMGLSDEIEQK